MKTIYTYPKRSNSTSESSGWNDEWENYSVERTLVWNKNCETIKILEKYLQKDTKILEAGCGLGRLVINFKKNGYDIMGVDWSVNAIKKIKEFDDQIPVEHGDLRKLKYENEFFSSYISEGVIEHFPQGPSEILNEANRVLKKDGLLLISVPIYNLFSKITLPFSECNFLRKILNKSPLDYQKNRKFDYYLFSIKEFKNCIESAGFKIVEIYPILQAAGLYRTIPFFRNKKIIGDFDIFGNTDKCLNLPGKLVLKISRKVLPWIHATCAYCVAKKL